MERRRSLSICCRAPAPYAEIWRSGESRDLDEEPILGGAYLPRKFKPRLIHLPQNDIDLHANDMNFVAIAENGKLVGFNLRWAGACQNRHGNKKTYARTAGGFGFLPAGAHAGGGGSRGLRPARLG